MKDTIDDAFRTAAASIEHLVRVIVREEIRQHLDPEGDHLINVRSAPMSARKLRHLVNSGQLEGFRHGREMFVRASDFRAFVEGRPVRPARTVVREPPVDPEVDSMDDLRVELGVAPSDPDERRAFDLRLAQRRAAGGERAASLKRAEMKREEWQAKEKAREERRARRAESKKRKRKA